MNGQITFSFDRHNRYVFKLDGKPVGFVYGKSGYWRASDLNGEIYREGRTKQIAAERIVRAVGI